MAHTQRSTDGKSLSTTRRPPPADTLKSRSEKLPLSRLPVRGTRGYSIWVQQIQEILEESEPLLIRITIWVGTAYVCWKIATGH